MILNGFWIYSLSQVVTSAVLKACKSSSNIFQAYNCLVFCLKLDLKFIEKYIWKTKNKFTCYYIHPLGNYLC